MDMEWWRRKSEENKKVVVKKNSFWKPLYRCTTVITIGERFSNEWTLLLKIEY